MSEPAGALVGCAPGQIAYGSGVEFCLDPPTGKVTAPDGTPAVAPRELTVPASVETGVQGSSESLVTKVGLVMEDSAAADGSVAVASEAVPGVGQVVQSGLMGFFAGQQIASLSCSAGVGVLCMPPKSPSFVPNSDVTVSDPGWRSGVQQWTSYSGSVRHIDVIAPVPTAGALGHVTFQITLVSGGTGFADGYQAYDVNGLSSGCQSGNFNANSTITVSCASGTSVPGYVSFQSNGNATPVASMPLYWLPGYSARPPAPSANPARTLQTTNTCSKLDGSGNVTTSASSGSITETDANFPPAFPIAPACPSGSQLAGTTVVELTPGLPTKTIWQYNVPASVLAARQSYPLCMGHVCHLGLYRVQPDGSKASCFLAGSDCGGWFTDPNKSADYVCTYGTLGKSTDPAVALAECNAYAPTFDPKRQAQGVPYGDPATGQVPDTLTSPVTQPASNGGSCFPTGWGAAFVPSWIVDALNCVLPKLFVPTRLPSLAVTNPLPAGWLPALPALADGGCGPLILPSLNLGRMVGRIGPVTFVNTCDQPWPKVRGFTYYGSVALVLIGVGWRSLRMVMGALGMDVAGSAGGGDGE